MAAGSIGRPRPTCVSRRVAALRLAMLGVMIASSTIVLPLGAATSPERPDESRSSITPLTEIRALRLDSDVSVDGVLNDVAWQRPPNQGLIQNEPENGTQPTLPTEWWIAYDDDALYAAFRFHDPAPDSIDAAVARRDASLNTDEVVLELDTYNDDRTGFLFVVNAGGYIFDAAMYNDGQYDNSWDAVWASASRVDEKGWAAEMRIPFSQLRFPPKDAQVWGINVIRRCKRIQSEDMLFHRPRDESGHNSRFPDLVGLGRIEAGSSREGLVYGVGKGEYLDAESGSPFRDGSELAYDVGADLKWGLTSNLTLNGTINPDFGQVEVDPAVVNLSDVETFFNEKRPFFVQDSNTYRYGRDGTNNNWGFNWMDPMLFYSRRIGRSPQLGINNDNDYSESPTGTTILGAAKLSGTVGRTSVGALNALTARENHELVMDGTFSKELAEPLTNYTVVRASRTAENARHAIGGMLTSVQRDLSNEASRDALTRSAYTGGIDGWAFLDDDEVWAVRGYAAGSRISGEPDAIAGIQRSSRRYYQRPDADHLDYEPTRESLSGWTSRVMLNKQKGNTRLNTALGAVSPGFEINDVGFQSRADVINTHVVLNHQWTTPNKVFRTRDISLASYWTWNFGGTRNGGGFGAFYWAEFANYWSINGSVFYNPHNDNTRATRGGPIMRNPTNREFGLTVQSDRRKSWTGYVDGGAGWGAPGEAYAYGGFGVTLKPNPALKVTLSPAFFWENEDAQYVDTFEDDVMTETFGHRYLFGDLEYKEVSMSARIDWSFTPRLTLQTYVQPLIAVGDYRRLKEFARPGSYAFNVYGEAGASSIAFDEVADEYTIDPGDGGETFSVSNPDFNFKSLRLNMVLRWEYDPGSTFFLVWTRNGTDSAHPGDFDLGRDVGSLLDAPGEDIVQVKVTRWFDF